MSLFTYNQIFIAFYLVLIVVIGHGHGMFFKTFLLLCLIVLALSNLFFRVLLSQKFQSLKKVNVLIITYVLSYIVLNLIIGKLDPNKVGLIPNLIKQYKDPDWYPSFVIPYLLTVVFTFVSYFFIEKNIHINEEAP